MNKIFILLFFLSINSFGQETLKLISETDLLADEFLGVNVYGEYFYKEKQILFKKSEQEIFSYQNNLYGKINNVDLFNSLESIVFYKDFNIVIQLDRWLGEINKIDLFQSSLFSNVLHVSLASKNRLWVFNNDTQQLLVYNPQQNIIESTTRSIEGEIVDFYSNYNFCWILTKNNLFKYNIYGTLLNSYELPLYESFVFSKKGIFLLKKNQLYMLKKGGNSIELLTLPKLSIQDFSVTNETLYIYNGKKVYAFKINEK